MKTILIIDDDKEIRDSVYLILEHEGYKVLLAENGEEGVKQALSLRPDLVLCDITMPGISGLDVFSEINHRPGHEIIPFIFVTALSAKANFRKAMHLGAADYITKPFEKDDLVGAIKIQLAKKEEIAEKLQDERIRLLGKLEDELLAKDLEIEKLSNIHPAHKEEETVSALQKKENLKPKAEKSSKDILMIVNNRLLRLRLISSIRKEFSNNILEADTIHDAFQILDNTDIAYIILESSPPKLDPLIMIRQIKCKANLMNCPILISAENINKETITEFAKFGNIDFILNPFSHEKLNLKISRHLETKSKEQV